MVDQGQDPPTTDFDVFVSHASEDKSYVGPLVKALKEAGIRVWFDNQILEWGDDLRTSITQGLSNCRYGIVVFSKAFLQKKKWTEYELNGLFARERSGSKLILPIWHGITREDLLSYSPTFADRLAKVSSTDDYINIVETLLRMLGRQPSGQASNRSTVSATVHEGLEWRSPLSALTMPEELYLLCCCKSEDSYDGRTGLTEFGMTAAAVAQLAIAKRINLSLRGSAGDVWLTVIDQFPLGEPVLDYALHTLHMVGSRELNITQPETLGGILGEERKGYVAINRLVHRGILGEDKKTKWLFFTEYSRPLLGVGLQNELRRKLLLAAAHSSISDYVAVFLVVADLCGYLDQIFVEKIRDFRQSVGYQLAKDNGVAKTIAAMVNGAIAIRSRDDIEQGAAGWASVQ